MIYHCFQIHNNDKTLKSPPNSPTWTVIHNTCGSLLCRCNNANKIIKNLRAADAVDVSSNGSLDRVLLELYCYLKATINHCIQITILSGTWFNVILCSYQNSNFTHLRKKVMTNDYLNSVKIL